MGYRVSEKSLHKKGKGFRSSVYTKFPNYTASGEEGPFFTLFIGKF